ncbi:rhodanese-like domain-containing protein [Salipiger sp.]|uniref:rhodanese-like domain-containing protein n=1 Tax=Salipiger sp. TaxID=2078585 RepID=UPI003A9834F9
MLQGFRLTGLALCLATAPAWGLAQQSRLTPDRPDFSVTLNGTPVTIARTGAACPPACIQPMQAASGIVTIGELELLDFLDLFVSTGSGLLVDTRRPERYGAETLPGAVNVPAATLAPGNPYRGDLLEALGARGSDFSGAYDLVLFAEGPDASAAPESLRSLAEAGYPTEKLKYYRGGLRDWTALGLTTTAGAQ